MPFYAFYSTFITKKSDTTFIPMPSTSNHDHSYSREEKFGIISACQNESEFWGANQLHTYENALQRIVSNRNDFFKHRGG